MKNVKIIGYRLAVIVLLAMLPIVVSAVDYKNSYKPSGVNSQETAVMQAAAPTAVFQSTSTLPGSGSAYSATPMLGADGTAGAPARVPRGPRKEDTNGDNIDDETGLPVENVDNPGQNPGDQGNTPIGDAVVPLLLMAGAFAGVVYLRRRKVKA